MSDEIAYALQRIEKKYDEQTTFLLRTLSEKPRDTLYSTKVVAVMNSKFDFVREVGALRTLLADTE